MPGRSISARFLLGLLGGMALIVAGLHQVSTMPSGPILAFMLPVNTSAGKLAVVAVAVVFLVGFLLWSKRSTSAAFFRGVLAGMGFVLSVDIVWLHWIFGLHHITNTQMDFILEPLFVVLGIVFLWFAISRERRRAQ